MTDNHIHIGQFEDIYYDPREIVDIVMSSGMEGLSFSSTTSCIENVRYTEIEKEIVNLLAGIPYSCEIVRPFFWYIPDYMDQGIGIQSAFNGVPYKGIKIHPYANHWDFENNRHMEILHNLFDYATRNSLSILFHTGNSGIDSADRFEQFFKEYKEVQCILAHCRPLEITVKMLKEYNNVFCDTAFVSKEDILHIINSGYREKIIFGTDFPITHYFRTKYPKDCENSAITLIEQYKEDIFVFDEILEQGLKNYEI